MDSTTAVAKHYGFKRHGGFSTEGSFQKEPKDWNKSISLEIFNLAWKIQSRLKLSVPTFSRHWIWPGEGSTVQRKRSHVAPGKLNGSLLPDLLK